MNSKYLLDLKNFEQISFIGNGGFGEVYKIKHKKNEDMLAAKISLTIITKEMKRIYRNLNREITSLSEFNHPSIVKFIGFNPYNFHGEQKPTIVTEFLPNGSLYDILKLERRGLCKDAWNDTRKLICIYGIAAAMSYVHANHKMHRDLKPGNVLMDDFLCPKLADFGLSKTIHSNDDDSLTQDSSLSIMGTPAYIAPEIWKTMKYTQACDVYSFGVIVYEIMSGEEAWNGLNNSEIQRQVESGNRPKINSSVPYVYQELIENCWAQNPLERPTFNDIVDELRNNIDFITNLVEEDDFLDYVNYIDDYEITFVKNHISIDQFIKRESKTFSKVYIQSKQESLLKSKSSEKFKPKQFGLFKKSKSKILFPIQELDNLDETNKKLVEDSAGDISKEFKIGQFLIEGKENFPQNVEIGLLYIEHSAKNNSQDAAVYYSRLLIDGKIIPRDLEKANKQLNKFKKGNKGTIYFLKGQIKKIQKDFSKAIKHFEKAAKHGNAEGMYEYGKMLLKGIGCVKNEEKAKYYFEMSKNNGFRKSIKYLDYKQYMKEIADNGGIEEMNKYASMLYNGDYDHGIQIDKKEALEYYVKIADKGNVDAMIQCASMFYNGDGIKINKKEAFNYYKCAANEGNVKAMYQIALMLEKGDGINEDKKEAFNYFKIVANEGNVDAMYHCALMLDNGEGIKMNKKAAAKFYKNAADNGNTDAMFRLATMLDYGDGINENMLAAILYYKKATDKNHMKAMLRYAMILYNGEYVDINFEEALKYFRKLAERGNRDGMAMFSLIVFRMGGLKNDRNLAVDYAKTLAEEGNNIGMYVYGRMLNGDNNMIKANFKAASFYLRESANKGNEYAMVFYGKMIDSSDKKKSMYYYRKAQNILVKKINYEDFEAINVYGYMLNNGYGVSVDYNEAARYFKIAADKGHPISMSNYCCCLQMGFGVRKNRKEAARYAKMAADKGYSYSMYIYGNMLKDGDGVLINEKEAVRYYKMAAERGNIKAMNKYSLMQRNFEDISNSYSYSYSSDDDDDITRYSLFNKI